MHQSIRDPCRRTGVPPGGLITLDWMDLLPRRPKENPGANAAFVTLALLGRFPLFPEAPRQFWEHGKGKGSSVSVLRAARFEPHHAGAEVDLIPLQGEDFRNCPPASQIRKGHDRPQVGRELRDDCLEVLSFEKASPDVV